MNGSGLAKRTGTMAYTAPATWPFSWGKSPFHRLGRLLPGCLATALAVALLTGCQTFSKKTPPGPSRQELQARIEQLNAERTELKQWAAELQQELATLRGFDTDRLQQLVHVAQLEFGRYTRATEKGVTVYVVIRDQKHDTFKAAGTMTIELWQLDRPPDERLLGQWRYEPAQLEEHWLCGFLTYHYKFKLPWTQGKHPGRDGVTIRVRFEELLTGKAFEMQKLVTVAGRRR